MRSRTLPASLPPEARLRELCWRGSNPRLWWGGGQTTFRSASWGSATGSEHSFLLASVHDVPGGRAWRWAAVPCREDVSPNPQPWSPSSNASDRPPQGAGGWHGGATGAVASDPGSDSGWWCACCVQCSVGTTELWVLHPPERGPVPRAPGTQHLPAHTGIGACRVHSTVSSLPGVSCVVSASPGLVLFIVTAGREKGEAARVGQGGGWFYRVGTVDLWGWVVLPGATVLGPAGCSAASPASLGARSTSLPQP